MFKGFGKTRQSKHLSGDCNAAVPARSLAFGCLLSLPVTYAPAAFAQMHHTEAPQHVTRAVGVYEWTGDLTKPTAARFVPVSLFIDGHLQDAGLYLARPVPLALQPGDVYAVERAGEPQGTLDLDLAHRVVTGTALVEDNPVGAWYGFGRFTPQSTPAVVPLHPSSQLSKLESSGPTNSTPNSATDAKETPDTDRPHMNRRDAGSGNGGSGNAGSGNAGSGTGTGSGNSPNPPSSTGTADDDTDRPTLRRRDPAQDAARRKEAGTRSKTASVTAAGPALGDDPDRPILGHGNTDTPSTPELTGLPAGLHQAAAVSDAAHIDTHPFSRPWESPAERAQTIAAMASLAKTYVAQYLTANQLRASITPLPAPEAARATGVPAPIDAASPSPSTSPSTAASNPDGPAPPKLERGVPKSYGGTSTPSPTQSSAPTSSPSRTAAPKRAGSAAASARPRSAAAGAHRPTKNLAKEPAKASSSHPATPALGQEEIQAFTLSYGGLPTFVYQAAAWVAPARSSPFRASSKATSIPSAVYVTVVARRLPSGELQVALANVTDNAHLDRTPRQALIDAVDADNSHRASLLFELRAAASRQFALYRLTSAHAEQIFTTASLE